ncbi:MAG: RNA-binding protein [Gammaproteobacteria bacterium]|nr:RNA-binding protein [Gammaproteobacteria bacterium]
MKLSVRNLSRTSTEAELRTLFATYGDVQSCNIVNDQDTGISKGFGFVTMAKSDEAKAAMKNLNRKDVAGGKIRVTAVE